MFLGLLCAVMVVAVIVIYVYIIKFYSLGYTWWHITLFTYVMSGILALFILLVILLLEKVHENPNKRVRYTKNRL